MKRKVFKGPDGKTYVYNSALDEEENNFFSQRIQQEPKFKFPSKSLTPDDLKESAIRRVCGIHGLTLAREIVWAQEAVEFVGLTDYTFAKESMTGAYQITELEKLKLSLWDSKIAEHIRHSQLLFRNDVLVFNALWPSYKSKFEQEQKELLSKIVAHVMINGNEGPKKGTGFYEDVHPTAESFQRILNLISKP